MIRITLERKNPIVTPDIIVKEFADAADACTWFVEDSYFAESYTIKATWERVEPAAQVTRFFTFGNGQCHPVTGEALKDRYVEIAAESVDHCRAVMLNHFGNEWSFDYPTAKEAGVGQFNLRELPRAEWPPFADLYTVDASGCCVLR